MNCARATMIKADDGVDDGVLGTGDVAADSPPEVMYFRPPMMIMMTAMTPTMTEKMLMIFLINVVKLARRVG